MSEPLSILIVDDNPSMATSLADVLEVKGFQVRATSSGNEALEFLAANPVDVLLTDVKMQEMDGLALFRAARKKYPRLVTIFMTAYAADDLIQQGMAEGIKTVLNKPLDMDLLIMLFSAYKNILKKND
jgi:CheY-like chemotaxis protein